MIAVSIVSHAHGSMLKPLIDSLLDCPEVRQIFITLNIPELIELPPNDCLQVIFNDRPQGFGANHNKAFKLCAQPFFCPLNPDISIGQSPFPQLLSTIRATGSALVAPLIFSPNKEIDDSVRHFPRVRMLLLKVLTGRVERYTFDRRNKFMYPEWVGGMFMLFRSEAFAQLGGFDEGFFLYYEDVDICVRAWKAGLPVVVCQTVGVIHDARRESHRNLRHFCWHLTSMFRYFFKHWWRLPKVPFSSFGEI